MKDKEKQGFLFRYRWASLLDHLSAGQVALVIKAMTAFSKGQNIKKIQDKMVEKTIMAWEWILDDLQQDIKSYEDKCAKNRENAKLGGQAKARNSERYISLPNAPERVLKNANGSETCHIDRDRDKDRDSDKDKERDKMAISLSHKKFCETFPDRKKQHSVERLPENFDITRLIASMRESNFLMRCPNLDFDWCVKHYTEITANKYKNFSLKVAPAEQTKIRKREYTNKEKNGIFDNFANLDLEG